MRSMLRTDSDAKKLVVASSCTFHCMGFATFVTLAVETGWRARIEL